MSALLNGGGALLDVDQRAAMAAGEDGECGGGALIGDMGHAIQERGIFFQARQAKIPACAIEILIGESEVAGGFGDFDHDLTLCPCSVAHLGSGVREHPLIRSTVSSRAAGSDN